MVNQSSHQNGHDNNVKTKHQPGFTEIHNGQPISKERSMLAELDPNPSMKATAPMDAISNPPVLEELKRREVESVSPSERRLDSTLLDELKELLADPFVRCISVAKTGGEQEQTEECKEEEDGDAEVWEYGTDDFRLHSAVFNGTVRSRAPLLVRPRTARQVSRCVLVLIRRDDSG